MGQPAASGPAGAEDLSDRELTLPDGRTIGWGAYGDPEGHPVVFLHGTPGSRQDAFTVNDAAAEEGICVVAVDRPGMGRSTQVPGRRLLDHVEDVRRLMDELGFDRFSVLAYSGGGPYGLAVAARLRERLDRVVVVSGCAPPDPRAVRSDTGVIDRVLTQLARRAPWGAGLVVGSMAVGARAAPRIGLRLWEADLSEMDREAFRELVQRREVNPLGSFLEAVRQGPGGVVDDYRLLAEPWGFLPEEIEHRVRFWHGDDDPIVPLHHAHDLVARLEDAHLTVVSGAGHLLIRSAARQIMADLRP